MSATPRTPRAIVTPDPKEASEMIQIIMDGSVPEPYSGCWFWTGCLNSKGYGCLQFKKRGWLAHRMAFTAFIGAPSGILCHKCDNSACCNPRHLFDGSFRDNLVDCVLKGRRNAPVRNNIDQVRTWRAAGWGYQRIANELGVHRSAIKPVLEDKYHVTTT